ncbi:putative argonaute family protein [Lyophyllum shimeji]|uniref:Argonaute family protein n=1 Tax=Lyophyllum shimeji TaxID=47721 RepID=A0A9P3ULH6_LYOSH|nr:putative argonaute family protein [Lyophyllum shimeji]
MEVWLGFDVSTPFRPSSTVYSADIFPLGLPSIPLERRRQCADNHVKLSLPILAARDEYISRRVWLYMPRCLFTGIVQYAPRIAQTAVLPEEEEEVVDLLVEPEAVVRVVGHPRWPSEHWSQHSNCRCEAPGYGTAGKALAIHTNSYVLSTPEKIIRHYDIGTLLSRGEVEFVLLMMLLAIEPGNLHHRINTLLVKKLQYEVAADVFTPRAVYDGRKNMFASRELPLGPTNARQFDVTLAPNGSNPGDRPPKVYKIKVTKVNEINPEVLEPIMALNVVIRMDPSERLPFNVRSFFTDRETKNLGGGIVLWRGYFQSVRPGLGHMLVNVDISTGMMYQPDAGWVGHDRIRLLSFSRKSAPSISGPSLRRGWLRGVDPAGALCRATRTDHEETATARENEDVLDFATMKPEERFRSIANGLQILSRTLAHFAWKHGVLNPPTLRYGQGSKQPTITPRDGAWNMIDKRFFQPKSIDRSVGMVVKEEQPLIKWENGQGRIAEQLRNAGAECARKNGGPPNLIVVVLPDGGNDIYTAVKHFGDVTMGYWANVCLKINPKLGGINTIPDPASVAALTDPHNPTIVMGADQKQEMIDDLQSMCKKILSLYMDYRTKAEKRPGNGAPKRLLFYRDGVSEGEFQQVLDIELPRIKAACAELKIDPKITIVVVGKRHHNRFKTERPQDADRSGNCPAGTVVDRVIGHPTEFDFFLQSHGGLLGTSRPAHYSVLYDENGFTADSMQGLSFALCHVYARSTRSVSIPAPVYYADIVCSRAKNHYDPTGGLDFSDSMTQTGSQADDTLQAFKTGYKPLHPNMSKVMYFS